MEKIEEKFSNPIKDWRRRSSVENSSRWAGEHAGYDNTPLPRFTAAGLGMGVLVSMGGFVFGYGMPFFLTSLRSLLYPVLLFLDATIPSTRLTSERYTATTRVRFLDSWK